jgi:glycosyltransferase involved in cell wall biosynthesis
MKDFFSTSVRTLPRLRSEPRSIAQDFRTPAQVDRGARPRVGGKFLFVGGEKLYVRGVTYGSFRPNEDGVEFHDPALVERDFADMAANGLNAVRTYTVPPRWLLDAAERHGLRVMVGLPWEQHVTFLDDKRRVQDIERRIRDGVQACAGHPAVLCYAIGNEIPASIVRWHGARPIERYIERLYEAAKEEDPDGLITYVNYPSTEYLQLPFLDLVCFNVYLESQERLEAYLSRLHNIAGDRPLVMAEVGLDSRRNGEDGQARSLDWQIRTAFAAGCAGGFVFAWTDEWHRGGYDVDDWDFGLTDRDRHPKPALAAAREAFADVPFSRDLPWPRISVVVCSYNGERTIRECLKGLSKLDYPNYEVIVVDDGSTDATAAIAQEYGLRVISTENRGLASARNTGLEAADGEIVAYIDDDASPDPHWLTYLAATFLNSGFSAVGGPNIPPPGDGRVADCVANAPGGPIHVLFSDREAEHIPGCNMAFRKEGLQAVGGFDPQFRTAGDDVDVCWRLQDGHAGCRRGSRRCRICGEGWMLGFSPAAMVWHRRRNSVRAYWRQQVGYGKAEALLERKWPNKYNSAGHLSWGGRLYGKGLSEGISWGRRRIYQGIWGTAPFQSVYKPADGLLSSLPLMPEWYLVILSLAVLSVLGALWKPLFLALPLLALAVCASLTQAVHGALKADLGSRGRSIAERLQLRGLTVLLHLLQPLARLEGRIRHGLAPWRLRGLPRFFPLRPFRISHWGDSWHTPEERLRLIEELLRASGLRVARGGGFDQWDIEVRGGMLGTVRLVTATEEHGWGKQLARYRIWPRWRAPAVLVVAFFAALAGAAAIEQAWPASALLGMVTGLLGLRTIAECGAATSTTLQALERAKRSALDADYIENEKVLAAS